ncbi:MAG: tRNA (adenosine(37)-N6)-dimethylallyltransferase MiaA [Verrucomicrobiota bacterium]
MSITQPLFLLGATGVGKSAAALELARAWGGGVRAAILCLDAMQVYRGADIGTSKPTLAERAEIPHGGLDLSDLGSRFDVAQYLAHAAAFLRAQGEAGRRVIIVGGTGLYFRALTRGLCEAPQGSDELRAELAALPVNELRARLERVDPGMLAHLDAKNPRRLTRAIEVMESTGKSLRAWQDETPEPLVRDFTAIWLQREREELHARIEKRIDEMFAVGWAEEVRGLVTQHGLETVRAFPGIGYREIAEALASEGSGVDPGLQGNILVATRQYAKRQLTWFAREPTLRAVMLTGHSPLSAAVPALF